MRGDYGTGSLILCAMKEIVKEVELLLKSDDLYLGTWFQEILIDGVEDNKDLNGLQ